MRLSEQQRNIIITASREIFGENIQIYLFGSRVDDNKRGGDIDILVNSQSTVEELSRKSLQLVARLQMRLGDQPIDVLAIDSKSKRLPIHEEALKTGLLL